MKRKLRKKKAAKRAAAMNKTTETVVDIYQQDGTVLLDQPATHIGLWSEDKSKHVLIGADDYVILAAVWSGRFVTGPKAPPADGSAAIFVKPPVAPPAPIHGAPVPIRSDKTTFKEGVYKFGDGTIKAPDMETEGRRLLNNWEGLLEQSILAGEGWILPDEAEHHLRAQLELRAAPLGAHAELDTVIPMLVAHYRTFYAETLAWMEAKREGRAFDAAPADKRMHAIGIVYLGPPYHQAQEIIARIFGAGAAGISHADATPDQIRQFAAEPGGHVTIYIGAVNPPEKIAEAAEILEIFGHPLFPGIASSVTPEQIEQAVQNINGGELALLEVPQGIEPWPRAAHTS